MSEEQHRTEVHVKQHATRKSWGVVCSCGYVSRWFNFYRDAERDEADHELRPMHAPRVSRAPRQDGALK
jgi:hypothetical protein